MHADSLPGDIVIVGGGPAGLTTALALVEQVPRLRSRLVVLERDRYPREKICAGAVSGLADKLLASLDVRLDVPSEWMAGHAVRTSTGLSVARPGGVGRVVRRSEYDAALADVARARGIRVEDGCKVLSVGRRDQRQTIPVETERGTIHAVALVGADGVGSIVRRAIGAKANGLRARVIEVDTPPVESDLARDLLHFDVSDHRLAGYAWDFATLVDGVPMVCRGVYQLVRPAGDDAERDRDERSVQDLLAARLEAIGLDLTRCRNKRFAERGYAVADELATDDVILVGEAAGIDPLSGEGIGPAIEYGVLAGRFLASHLGGSLRGWSRAVKRSRLSIDLRVRSALIAPYFGGALRTTIDGALLRSPASLTVLGDAFAGRAPKLRDIASAAADTLSASLAARRGLRSAQAE